MNNEAVPSPSNGLKTGGPDLSQLAVRSEYTPAAIEGFVNVVRFWRVSSKEASALIGKDDQEWFKIIEGRQTEPLSQEVLMRISGVVGLYKGLHLLFSEPLADDWVRRPNSEAMFKGTSPLDFMIAGGQEAILVTRAYIDALRGGL
jgi:hypothetical protein